MQGRRHIGRFEACSTEDHELKNSVHFALAGLSMGGGQTLTFGLAHVDTFAWIGAFSASPNTKPASELVPDPASTKKQLKLLSLACGKRDNLLWYPHARNPVFSVTGDIQVLQEDLSLATENGREH
jgi:enterochelin esterase-like enzyme